MTTMVFNSPARWLCLLWSILWAGVGCTAVDVLNPVARTAVVDATALDFGTVMLGEPVERAVRVTNRGEGAIAVAVDVTPAGGPFVTLLRSVQADSGGVDVRVQFVAIQPGTYDGTLTLSTQDDVGTVFTVTLHGTATGAPNCDDANPCTLDLWDGTACTHNPVAAACDDGNTCTQQDRCVDGTCTGNAINCDDGVECTADTCDGALGCQHLPRAEACDDGNACTADACLPLTGCTHPVAPNGTLCGFPACDAMPLCVSGACTTLPAPDGFPCEDGDVCTLGDVCRAGTCTPGLGEPMGVSSPTVVALPEPHHTGGQVEPTDVLGLMPQSNGSVRVLWRTRVVPDASCADNVCLPELVCTEALTNADGFTLRTALVATDGSRSEETVLPLPGTLMAPILARASPTSEGLAVVALYASGQGCLNGDDAAQRPSAVFMLWHVKTDGSVAGPWPVGQQFGMPADPTRSPVGVSALGNDVVVVTGQAVQSLCMGTCPAGVELKVSIRSLGNPAQELSSGTLRLPAEGTGELSVHALLTGNEVLLALEERLAPTWGSENGCGFGVVPHVRVTLQTAPRSAALAFAPRNLPVASEQTAGVALAAGTLGPALMVGSHLGGAANSCACEGGESACDACVCNPSPLLSIQEGGEVYSQPLVASGDPQRALVRLSGASAFGRAVAVALLTDGTLSIASPPMGVLPALSAEVTPDPSWGVIPDERRSPVLARDGTGAWLGATVVSNISPVPMRALALVRAGCGVTPGGSIQGLPDAGLSLVAHAVDAGAYSDGDAGTPGDADGGTPVPQSPSVDGGAPADAG